MPGGGVLPQGEVQFAGGDRGGVALDGGQLPGLPVARLEAEVDGAGAQAAWLGVGEPQDVAGYCRKE